MLLINTHLDVVADIGPAISADRHHAAVGVCERDLGFTALVKLHLQFLGLLPHAFHLIDLVLEFLRSELLFLWLFFVGFIHLVQVSVDVIVQFLDRLLKLLLVEALGATVDGFELAAVDGDQVSAEELKLLAKEGELPADQADGLAVIPSEVCDGLEIGRETFDEPHDFDVAMRFPFQLTAGAYAVEIAIEVELQEITRVIRRSTGILENSMGETHLIQVKGVEECVDKANGAFLRDVIIESFREEGHLIPIETFDMLHGVPRSRQRGGLSLLSH